MNAMEVPERRGLRERKKARTRTDIRAQALRLFLEQGYEATTVQQIADAAEVSLSTLFRYFPTKALLVLPFDLATLVRDAFHHQTPDDTVFDAIHTALRASFDELSAITALSDANDAHAFQALARARDALRGELTGLVGVLAELIGERWEREPHDPLVQAAAGSVVGIAIAAWAADRDVGRASALQILEVGMRGLEDGLVP
jgi:AcrR family transcriptional regulator